MDGLQMPSCSQRRSSETSKSSWDSIRKSYTGVALLGFQPARNDFVFG